jgi:DNA topoisomerase-3
MTKTLIIAEKPSVAQDIVRALTPSAGKFDKHDEYFENEQLRRHLGRRPPGGDQGAGGIRRQARQVELRQPAGDPAALRPGKPIDKSKARLNAVVKLVKRKDVSTAHQRLRRRARGRADLSPDRAVRAA